MNHFDIIYYINLDERPDRKNHIESQLLSMNVDMNKVKRIPGIHHSVKSVGCTMAHLECLYDFQKNNYNTCLILEDDFTFKYDATFTNGFIQKFFDTHLAWDILMLTCFDREVKPSTISWLMKAINVQTASAYAVHKDFLQQLIPILEQGMQLSIRENRDVCEGCNDQSWKVLQPTSNWYICNPKLGYQLDNFSNLQNTHVSYPDKNNFPDTVLKYPYKYVFGVTTCYRTMHLTKNQYDKWLTNIHAFPFLYLKFVGNPMIDSDWIYNEKEQLLILRCEDDYINLPNKIYMYMKAVHTLFPKCKGVFKTDDDIDIYLDKLYTLLESHQNIPYVGKKFDGRPYLSTHLSFKPHLVSKYPEFEHIPVQLKDADYCAGGGYYLHMTTVEKLLKHSDIFKPFPTNNYMDFLNDTKTHFENLHVFEDKTVGYALRQENVLPYNVDIKSVANWEGL